MGWYRVVKTVKGHRYLYEQRSWREGKKVRTESRYIGPADEHTGTSTPVITTKVGSAGLYDTKVYRASNRPFTNKNFKDDDALGKVMFFGDRPEIAKMYG